VIFPVVVPVGTVAVICVSEFTVNVTAAVALNATAVAAVKLVPVSVTTVPTGPFEGLNEVIAGVTITVKFVALVPVPAEFVTVIFPVVAPVGTVAVICVSEFTVNATADVALNATAVAAVKLVPVSVTTVPTGPFEGLKEEISGAFVTVKLVALVPVPAEFVTVIFPVVAPVGTVAVICVSEFTVNVVAAEALNETAVAAVKPVPVSVTTVLTGPFEGLKEVIAGVTITVKLVALVPVPAEFVAVIFPVVAPVGTVAVICVSEFTVNVTAAVALKATAVVPLKPVPVSVTTVPTGPFEGLNEVIAGATITVTLVALVPVPAGLVTLIFPVVAPVGTVAVI